MNFIGLESIGGALKQRRKELGLSQDQLAQRAGVTQTQISGLERGANARTATTIAVLRALGLEMVFTPRELLPAVRALIDADTPPIGTTEKPLYAIEDED